MREEKQLLLDEIKGYIEDNSTFLVMNYAGLNAGLTHSFRSDIHKSGGFVEIVRKRVFVKAAIDAGVPFEVDQLPGHIGLVFAGEDPLEAAKITFKFQNDNEKVINVLGARFDGEMYSADQIEQLSKLPGKQEMRAQLLSVFAAPMTQTLGVMQSLLTSVVYCLDNKAKQES